MPPTQSTYDKYNNLIENAKTIHKGSNQLVSSGLSDDFVFGKIQDDGHWYTGELNSNGKPHGWGSMTYGINHKYQGRFLNGKPDGLGKEEKGKEEKGKVEHYGIFVDGKPKGMGLRWKKINMWPDDYDFSTAWDDSKQPKNDPDKDLHHVVKEKILEDVESFLKEIKALKERKAKDFYDKTINDALQTIIETTNNDVRTLYLETGVKYEGYVTECEATGFGIMTIEKDGVTSIFSGIFKNNSIILGKNTISKDSGAAKTLNIALAISPTESAVTLFNQNSNSVQAVDKGGKTINLDMNYKEYTGFFKNFKPSGFGKMKRYDNSMLSSNNFGSDGKVIGEKRDMYGTSGLITKLVKDNIEKDIKTKVLDKAEEARNSAQKKENDYYQQVIQQSKPKIESDSIASVSIDGGTFTGELLDGKPNGIGEVVVTNNNTFSGVSTGSTIIASFIGDKLNGPGQITNTDNKTRFVLFDRSKIVFDQESESNAVILSTSASATNAFYLKTFNADATLLLKSFQLNQKMQVNIEEIKKQFHAKKNELLVFIKDFKDKKEDGKKTSSPINLEKNKDYKGPRNNDNSIPDVGSGQIFFEDGTIYDGHFEKGLADGQGKYTLIELTTTNPSNNRLRFFSSETRKEILNEYDGDFKKGFKFGKGTLKDHHNKITYTGEFKDDLKGFMTKVDFPDSSNFTGWFLNELGFGVYTYKNHSLLYKGFCKNGKPHGMGILIEKETMYFVQNAKNGIIDTNDKNQELVKFMKKTVEETIDTTFKGYLKKSNQISNTKDHRSSRTSNNTALTTTNSTALTTTNSRALTPTTSNWGLKQYGVATAVSGLAAAGLYYAYKKYNKSAKSTRKSKVKSTQKSLRRSPRLREKYSSARRSSNANKNLRRSERLRAKRSSESE